MSKLTLCELRNGNDFPVLDAPNIFPPDDPRTVSAVQGLFKVLRTVYVSGSKNCTGQYAVKGFNFSAGTTWFDKNGRIAAREDAYGSAL